MRSPLQDHLLEERFNSLNFAGPSAENRSALRIVQDYRIRLENLRDVLHRLRPDRLRCIGQQNRPAEGIELLGLPLPPLGLERLLLGSIGEMAGHKRRHQERKQRHPVLRVGNGEGPTGGRKKKL